MRAVVPTGTTVIVIIALTQVRELCCGVMEGGGYRVGEGDVVGCGLVPSEDLVLFPVSLALSSVSATHARTHARTHLSLIHI